MKKLAIASAIIALSSSVFAAGAAENSFYIKAGGAGSWGAEIDSANKVDLGVTSTDMGAMNFSGGVGFGYYLMDNIRAEVALSYVNGPKYEDLKSVFSDTATFITKMGVYTPAATGKVTIQNSGFVGSVNGFVDVADMGAAKLYVGGGVGASYLESKITTSGFAEESENQTAEFKKEFALSYNLGAGLSFEASPGMLLDFGYSYMDLGKPGKVNTSVGTLTTSDNWPLGSLYSHNLNVGVRFSM